MSSPPKYKSRPHPGTTVHRGTTLVAGMIMPTSLILNGDLRFSILSVPENSSQMRFTENGAAGLTLCSGSLVGIHSYSSDQWIDYDDKRPKERCQ